MKKNSNEMISQFNIHYINVQILKWTYNLSIKKQTQLLKLSIKSGD
jgi:hypothetical protein